MNKTSSAFWSIPPEQILQEMETSPQGLTGIEAQKRLKQYGLNLLKPP